MDLVIQVGELVLNRLAGFVDFGMLFSYQISSVGFSFMQFSQAFDLLQNKQDVEGRTIDSRAHPCHEPRLLAAHQGRFASDHREVLELF